jgi:hypothetical protein
MPGIPDSEMVAQLNCFMRAVITQWTWAELAALGKESHVEYRGPESNFVTFDLHLLENEANAPRPYLNVMVGICDLRDGKDLGSAHSPLCNNFILYRDGEIDAKDLAGFAYGWQDG